MTVLIREGNEGQPNIDQLISQLNEAKRLALDAFKNDPDSFPNLKWDYLLIAEEIVRLDSKKIEDLDLTDEDKQVVLRHTIQ